MKRVNIDTLAYLYIAGCGVFLAVTVLPLGLYSDDYWNLHVSADRSFGGFLQYHLANTNSRYVYALYHRLLTDLFFDPSDLFGARFIHVAHILGTLMHSVVCFLLYRLLRALRINAVAVFAVLPLLVFPLFGKQAVLWIGAYMAHVIGLLSFLIAAWATLKHRAVPLVIGTVIAVGASEFVLVPSLMLVGFYGWNEWRDAVALPKKPRLKQVFVRTAPLMLPFVAYAVLVLSSNGLHRRIHVLEQYHKTQLWAAPLTFAGQFFGHYLPTLQPVDLFRELPLLLVPFFAALFLLSRSKKEAIRTGVLIAFLLGSLFPLAAVGYYTGGSRLRYIVGIFFYVCVAQALSAGIERWKTKQLQRIAFGLVTALTFALTIYLATQFRSAAQDGRRAYDCITAVTMHLYKETDGVAPDRIEWCGESNRVGEFPVINRSSLPHALALKYGTEEPIRIERLKTCDENHTPFFAPSACTNPLWYKIHP